MDTRNAKGVVTSATQGQDSELKFLQDGAGFQGFGRVVKVNTTGSLMNTQGPSVHQAKEQMRCCLGTHRDYTMTTWRCAEQKRSTTVLKPASLPKNTCAHSNNITKKRKGERIFFCNSQVPYLFLCGCRSSNEYAFVVCIDAGRISRFLQVEDTDV